MSVAEIKLRMLALRSLSSTLDSIVFSVDKFAAADAAARGRVATGKKIAAGLADDDDEEDDFVHVSHVDVTPTSGSGEADSPLPAAVAALVAADAGGGSPGVASPGVDFQKVLHQRKLMEEAVKIWKEKPKNAIKFLVQRGEFKLDFTIYR